MKAFKLLVYIFIISFMLMFVACNSDDSGTTSPTSGSDSDLSSYSESATGTLSINLTDASTDEYKAIYVTIKEVLVCKGKDCDQECSEDCEWIAVATPNKTYNLLELVNGAREELGIKELEAGHYCQIRLIIGDNPDDECHPYANYVIDKSDSCHELKIPSEFQTGIKIVKGFDICGKNMTELILDFDASRSVVRAGNSGKWLLKPTIKILCTLDSVIVSGTITNNEEACLESALVSAQVYNPDATDSKNQVTIQTSTIADENGAYQLCLPESEYNIVVSKEGFFDDCVKIEVGCGVSYELDMSLADASTGNIKGTITVPDCNDDQSVMLRVRQETVCEGSCEGEQIEVKTISIATDEGGTEYSIKLAEGTYSVVAVTDGKETFIYDGIDVIAGSDTELEITF